MRRKLIAVTFFIALGAGCATAREPAAVPGPDALGPELGKLLAGRTPGKPVSCISLPQAQSSTMTGNAIVYKSSNNRWYVNFPDGGRCDILRKNRSIVTRTPGTQLCRGDIVRVVDFPSRFEYGACGMGDFIPYSK